MEEPGGTGQDPQGEDGPFVGVGPFSGGQHHLVALNAQGADPGQGGAVQGGEFCSDLSAGGKVGGDGGGAGKEGGKVHIVVGSVAQAVHQAGLGGGGDLQEEGQGAGGADGVGGGEECHGGYLPVYSG